MVPAVLLTKLAAPLTKPAAKPAAAPAVFKTVSNPDLANDTNGERPLFKMLIVFILIDPVLSFPIVWVNCNIFEIMALSSFCLWSN
ncbi:hypothetical protein CVS40_2163 [Lucilia cuprina]|nr:hypothetical protein CVS40_2163 [Lucilia cuprina]